MARRGGGLEAQSKSRIRQCTMPRTELGRLSWWGENTASILPWRTQPLEKRGRWISSKVWSVVLLHETEDFKSPWQGHLPLLQGRADGSLDMGKRWPQRIGTRVSLRGNSKMKALLGYILRVIRGLCRANFRLTSWEEASLSLYLNKHRYNKE